MLEPVRQRLPLSTTVLAVKQLAARLFKCDLALQRLSFRESAGAYPALLDDDQRPLSYYGVAADGEILVEEVDPAGACAACVLCVCAVRRARVLRSRAQLFPPPHLACTHTPISFPSTCPPSRALAHFARALRRGAQAGGRGRGGARGQGGGAGGAGGGPAARAGAERGSGAARGCQQRRAAVRGRCARACHWRQPLYLRFGTGK